MALNLTRDNGQKITNSINLVKAKRGQSLNLKKIAPTMSKVLIMLNWEGDADLDSSIVLLQSNGKPVDGVVKSDPVNGDTPRALVYYNNLDMTKGIKHGGDLRAGGQEEIDIDLSMIDSDVSEIIHVASAYSEGSKVTFGDVKSATITIVDAEKMKQF